MKGSLQDRCGNGSKRVTSVPCPTRAGVLPHHIVGLRRPEEQGQARSVIPRWDRAQVTEALSSVSIRRLNEMTKALTSERHTVGAQRDHGQMAFS